MKREEFETNYEAIADQYIETDMAEKFYYAVYDPDESHDEFMRLLKTHVQTNPTDPLSIFIRGRFEEYAEGK